MTTLIQAKLQGLCKGFKKVHDGYWVQEDLSDEALIQQFSQGHRQHLPIKDEQSEQILLETFLVNLDDFSSSPVFSSLPSRIWPMIDLFKIRSPSTLFEIIKIRSIYLIEMEASPQMSWWHLFLKTLPSLPGPIALKLISDYPGKKDLMFHLTCIKINQSGVDLPFPVANLEKLSITEICLLLKTMLIEEPFFPLLDFVTNAPNALSKFNQKTWLAETKDCLISKFQCLSIDSWMNLAEEYTCNLDPAIQWWDTSDNESGDEDEHCMMPSTLQLLVGDYCYTLINMLPAELSPTLSTFASKYKKEDELGISDLELDEILDKIANQFLEDWKIQAYIDHLKKNFFDEIMQSGKALSVLEQHPEYLLDSINDLYDNLDSGVEEQYSLFLKLLRLSDRQTVKELLTKGAKSLKASEDYSNSCLEQELRSFINRAVSGDDNDKEWLILVFQDEMFAVETLVREAINNPGKVEFAVNLLQALPCLNIDHILNIADVNLDKDKDSNEENVIQFMLHLSQVNKEFAQASYEKFVVGINDESEKYCFRSMKILRGLRPLVTTYDTKPFILLDQAIMHKQTRSVQDAEIQEMLQEFCVDEYAVDDKDFEEMLFQLPWIRPCQWITSVKVSSDLIDRVAVLLPTLAMEHQEYLIANLAKAILEKESLPQDDPMELARSLATLIEEFPKNVKLQSCFTKVLGQALAKDDVDYIALVKTISFLPTLCDTRALSLTKLKMMLDLNG